MEFIFTKKWYVSHNMENTALFIHLRFCKRSRANKRLHIIKNRIELNIIFCVKNFSRQFKYCSVSIKYEV